jgi:hypothetical protein
MAYISPPTRSQIADFIWKLAEWVTMVVVIFAIFHWFNGEVIALVWSVVAGGIIALAFGVLRKMVIG